MDTWLLSLTGGLLIGLSALLMFALLGRITGISGIFCALLSGDPDNNWRWLFLAGLIAAPFAYHMASGHPAPAPSTAEWPLTIVAGLLVGFGTRYGGGCTSGHGVCGIGRLSPRSIAATLVFMAAGIVTVSVFRHLIS